jgi:hypothetical protein
MFPYPFLELFHKQFFFYAASIILFAPENNEIRWCGALNFFFSILAWKVIQRYRKWSEKTSLGVCFLKFYFFGFQGSKKGQFFTIFVENVKNRKFSNQLPSLEI